jgi:hypothetical protein
MRCCSPCFLKPIETSKQILEAGSADKREFLVSEHRLKFYGQCRQCLQFGYPHNYPYNPHTRAHFFKAKCPFSGLPRVYHCEKCYRTYFEGCISKQTAQTGAWSHFLFADQPNTYRSRDKSQFDLKQQSLVATKSNKHQDEFTVCM